MMVVAGCDRLTKVALVALIALVALVTADVHAYGRRVCGSWMLRLLVGGGGGGWLLVRMCMRGIVCMFATDAKCAGCSCKGCGGRLRMDAVEGVGGCWSGGRNAQRHRQTAAGKGLGPRVMLPLAREFSLRERISGYQEDSN